MQPDFVGQLRCRLLELGCPLFQMRRLTREMADHHEDLKQAALAEGLSEIEATAQADSQLGDPFYLAEQKMVMLRQSSWWSRHCVIGFCLLPLLAAPLLWLSFLLGNLALAYKLRYGWSSERLAAAAKNPVILHHWVVGLRVVDYLSIALAALIFCWLARRSAVRFAWMVSACLICSLYALFLMVQIRPHAFTLGLYWSPHWLRAAIPLLVVGVIYSLQRLRIHKERQKSTL